MLATILILKIYAIPFNNISSTNTPHNRISINANEDEAEGEDEDEDEAEGEDEEIDESLPLLNDANKK